MMEAIGTYDGAFLTAELAKLQSFYAAHAPEKGAEAEKNLRKYAAKPGGVESLWKALRKKYGSGAPAAPSHDDLTAMLPAGAGGGKRHGAASPQPRSPRHHDAPVAEPAHAPSHQHKDHKEHKEKDPKGKGHGHHSSHDHSHHKDGHGHGHKHGGHSEKHSDKHGHHGHSSGSGNGSPDHAASLDPSSFYDAQRLREELQRLREFYTAHAPEKLSESEKLINKYSQKDGGIESLWRAMRKKYGSGDTASVSSAAPPAPPPPPAAAPSDSAGHSHSRSGHGHGNSGGSHDPASLLEAFYVIHAPEKIDTAATVAAKYQRKPEGMDGLWRALRKRFGDGVVNEFLASHGVSLTPAGASSGALAAGGAGDNASVSDVQSRSHFTAGGSQTNGDDSSVYPGTATSFYDQATLAAAFDHLAYFYEEHAPNKLPDVEKTIHKHSQKAKGLDGLWSALKKKYGVAPEPLPTSPDKAAGDIDKQPPLGHKSDDQTAPTNPSSNSEGGSGESSSLHPSKAGAEMQEKLLKLYYKAKAPTRTSEVAKLLKKYGTDEAGAVKIWGRVEPRYGDASSVPGLTDLVRENTGGAGSKAPQGIMKDGKPFYPRTAEEAAPPYAPPVRTTAGDVLSRTLWREPDPQPQPTLTSPKQVPKYSDQSKVFWRERLTKYYAYYRPTKTSADVDAEIARNDLPPEGFERMWAALINKYGPEPPMVVQDPVGHGFLERFGQGAIPAADGTTTPTNAEPSVEPNTEMNAKAHATVVSDANGHPVIVVSSASPTTDVEPTDKNVDGAGTFPATPSVSDTTNANAADQPHQALDGSGVAVPTNSGQPIPENSLSRLLPASYVRKPPVPFHPDDDDDDDLDALLPPDLGLSGLKNGPPEILGLGKKKSESSAHGASTSDPSHDTQQRSLVTQNGAVSQIDGSPSTIRRGPNGAFPTTVSMQAMLRLQGIDETKYSNATDVAKAAFHRAIESEIAANLEVDTDRVTVARIVAASTCELELEMTYDELSRGAAQALVTKTLTGTFTVKTIRESYQYDIAGNPMQIHAEGAAVFGGACTPGFSDVPAIDPSATMPQIEDSTIEPRDERGGQLEGPMSQETPGRSWSPNAVDVSPLTPAGTARDRSVVPPIERDENGNPKLTLRSIPQRKVPGIRRTKTADRQSGSADQRQHHHDPASASEPSPVKPMHISDVKEPLVKTSSETRASSADHPPGTATELAARFGSLSDILPRPDFGDFSPELTVGNAATSPPRAVSALSSFRPDKPSVRAANTPSIQLRYDGEQQQVRPPEILQQGHQQESQPRSGVTEHVSTTRAKLQEDGGEDAVIKTKAASPVNASSFLSSLWGRSPTTERERGAADVQADADHPSGTRTRESESLSAAVVAVPTAHPRQNVSFELASTRDDHTLDNRLFGSVRTDRRRQDVSPPSGSTSPLRRNPIDHASLGLSDGLVKDRAGRTHGDDFDFGPTESVERSRRLAESALSLQRQHVTSDASTPASHWDGFMSAVARTKSPSAGTGNGTYDPPPPPPLPLSSAVRGGDRTFGVGGTAGTSSRTVVPPGLRSSAKSAAAAPPLPTLPPPPPPHRAWSPIKTQDDAMPLPPVPPPPPALQNHIGRIQTLAEVRENETRDLQRTAVVPPSELTSYAPNEDAFDVPPPLPGQEVVAPQVSATTASTADKKVSERTNNAGGNGARANRRGDFASKRSSVDDNDHDQISVTRGGFRTSRAPSIDLTTNQAGLARANNNAAVSATAANDGHQRSASAGFKTAKAPSAPLRTATPSPGAGAGAGAGAAPSMRDHKSSSTVLRAIPDPFAGIVPSSTADPHLKSNFDDANGTAPAVNGAVGGPIMPRSAKRKSSFDVTPAVKDPFEGIAPPSPHLEEIHATPGGTSTGGAAPLGSAGYLLDIIDALERQ